MCLEQGERGRTVIGDEIRVMGLGEDLVGLCKTL